MHSLTEWALDFGPSTPVIIKSAFGYFSLNVLISGIEPPSPIC